MSIPMSHLETVISSVTAIFPSNPSAAFNLLNDYLDHELNPSWKKQGISLFNLFFILHNLSAAGNAYDKEPVKKYYMIFFGKEPTSRHYLKELENELQLYLHTLKNLNPHFVTQEVKDILKKEFILMQKSISTDVLNLYRHKAYQARNTVKNIFLEIIKIIDVQSCFRWKAERSVPSGYASNRDLVFHHNEAKLTKPPTNPEGDLSICY